MSVDALVDLLEHRHGLRLDELTDERLRHELEAGATLAEIAVEAYALRVAEDPALLAQLLDHVTLQESSFFRDPPVFAALADHLLPAAIRAAADGPLVVWSVGCANGQEPWSLAMLLTELGAMRFEVVATDLSAAAAARTRAATYDERELRGLDAARRDRFMVRAGARWRVDEPLRHRVRVMQHNAAAALPPVPDGSCAVVLCRYVLIYLTHDAADTLLRRIATALGADGRLVIGAAESLWHLSERFTPESLPHAVAYRRRRSTDDAGPREVLRHARAHPEPSAQRLPEHRVAGKLADGPESDAPRPPVRRSAPTTPRADTGARTSTSPAAPDGAALLSGGEAAAARGDLAAAAAAFRGAAHLAPNDAVPLVQLGLVLEAMGDPGAGGAYLSAWSAVGRSPAGELEAALGELGATALVRLLASKLEKPL